MWYDSLVDVDCRTVAFPESKVPTADNTGTSWLKCNLLDAIPVGFICCILTWIVVLTPNGQFIGLCHYFIQWTMSARPWLWNGVRCSHVKQRKTFGWCHSDRFLRIPKPRRHRQQASSLWLSQLTSLTLRTELDSSLTCGYIPLPLASSRFSCDYIYSTCLSV